MKKIVVVGGGTGSYTVLRGLKEFPMHLTAVVSMFDNGGSTGILRDEHGVLPSGDIRRALVALSLETDLMKKLFMHRFTSGKSLYGHNLGNLILLGLRDIFGSDEEAIRRAAAILKIKGTVLPVSLTSSHLHAVLQDGTIIIGETNIDIPKHNGLLRIREVFLSPQATVYDDTAAALKNADLIILGPGDLYTSVLPNLLVKGVKEAIAASHAKKAYVCNLMTKYGETHGYTASDHLQEISTYLKACPDYIICNNELFPQILLQKYQREKSYPVIVDEEQIGLTGARLIKAPLIGETLARHDSAKLASLLCHLGRGS